MLRPDFLTSDLHFGHANILTLCPDRKRWPGVHDLATHDQHIEDAWNDVVGPDHWVFVLGDFALGPKELLREYRRRLNGRLCLVLGNHDRSATACRNAGFDEVCKGTEFLAEGLAVACKHDPSDFTEVDAERYNVLLHGHRHNLGFHSGVSDKVWHKSLDVGVDAVGHPAPQSVAQVIARWRKQQFLH